MEKIREEIHEWQDSQGQHRLTLGKIAAFNKYQYNSFGDVGRKAVEEFFSVDIGVAYASINQYLDMLKENQERRERGEELASLPAINQAEWDAADIMGLVNQWARIRAACRRYEFRSDEGKPWQAQKWPIIWGDPLEFLSLFDVEFINAAHAKAVACNPIWRAPSMTDDAKKNDESSEIPSTTP